MPSPRMMTLRASLEFDMATNASVSHGNPEIVKAIVAAINTASRTGVAVQDAVRQALKDDRDALVGAAEQIEERNPEKAERNNKLSILRMQIRRGCQALQIEPALSVKKDRGIWRVLEAVRRDPSEVLMLKLRREAEDVAANLDKPSILSILRDGLIDAGWTPPPEERPRRGRGRPATKRAEQSATIQ